VSTTSSGVVKGMSQRRRGAPSTQTVFRGFHINHPPAVAVTVAGAVVAVVPLLAGVVSFAAGSLIAARRKGDDDEGGEDIFFWLAFITRL